MDESVIGTLVLSDEVVVLSSFLRTKVHKVLSRPVDLRQWPGPTKNWCSQHARGQAAQGG